MDGTVHATQVWSDGAFKPGAVEGVVSGAINADGLVSLDISGGGSYAFNVTCSA